MIIEFFFLIILVLIIYSAAIEPRLLEVQRLKLKVQHKRIKTKQKIVFISDLHIGFWDHLTGMSGKIKKLCQICEAEDVQTILIGGDIIDINKKYLPRLEKYLRAVASLGIPVIAVTGNHDAQSYNLNLASVERVLRKEGAIVLKNTSIKQGGVEIVGIQDLLGNIKYRETAGKWDNSETKKVVESLDWYQNAPKDEASVIILLSHNPDVVYLHGEPKADLILAGHTHGGQMAILDWLLDLNLIPFSQKKHLPLGTFCTRAGKVRRGNTRMLISRGFGSSGLPFRFLRRPQLHIIEIDNS